MPGGWCWGTACSTARWRTLSRMYVMNIQPARAELASSLVSVFTSFHLVWREKWGTFDLSETDCGIIYMQMLSAVTEVGMKLMHKSSNRSKNTLSGTPDANNNNNLYLQSTFNTDHVALSAVYGHKHINVSDTLKWRKSQRITEVSSDSSSGEHERLYEISRRSIQYVLVRLVGCMTTVWKQDELEPICISEDVFSHLEAADKVWTWQREIGIEYTESPSKSLNGELFPAKNAKFWAF